METLKYGKKLSAGIIIGLIICYIAWTPTRLSPGTYLQNHINLKAGSPPPSDEASQGIDKEHRDKLYNIKVKAQLEELRNPGVKTKSIKLMKLKDLGQFAADPKEYLSHVLPSRLVWVAELVYPSGAKTATGSPQNAVVLKVFDAETGAYYGHIAKSDKH